MRSFPLNRRFAGCRRAFISRGLLIAVVLLLAVPAIVWSMRPSMPWASEEALPKMQAVERGEFIHDITERGNIESASNVEIRCEVQALGSAGTRILEIVPEGTYVQAGDVLVKLDSSSLETDRMKQQITAENSRALLIQATNDYNMAIKARDEYLVGKFSLDEQAITSELLLAKEYRRRAEDYLRYSQRLFEKGYVTKIQLEGDKFSLTKYESDQKTAELKLKVLREYTKVKTMADLEATINTSKAKLEAQRYAHELDQQRLRLIETQIAKCIITATQPGQVVYANSNQRYNTEVIVEEGALVRERQVLIRLPDPKRMQVNAKINEAKIAMVKVGDPAIIHLDAFADVELRGTVQKVNEYPAPAAWYQSNVKEYETIVAIPESEVQLRPGLTAEVKIRVAREAEALLLPVQAVFEHGNKHYVVVREDKQWRAQQIEAGATNDKMVVIRSGLELGQEVVLNSAAYREKVTLPDLPPEPHNRSMLAGGKPHGSVKAVASRSGKGPGRAEPAGPQTLAAAVNPDKKPGDKPAEPNARQSSKAQQTAETEQAFASLDKNRSGFLEKQEVPDSLQARLGSADTNHDGLIDRREFIAAFMAGSRPDPKARAERGTRP